MAIYQGSSFIGGGGKSPYEYAEDAGFVGTEEEFYAASSQMPEHIGDINNPHNVSAAQVGAPTVAEMNAAIAAIPTPDVSGQIGAHNTNNAAHSDIRQAITSGITEAKGYADQKIAAIPTPDVSGQIGTHNTDTTAHSDIRQSIQTLNNRVDAIDYPVDSVNGKTGAVVLSAADVMADASGSAAAAETSAKSYTDEKIALLMNNSSEAVDSIMELASAMSTNKDAITALNTLAGTKVDKVSGKGLSTNDYTTEEKNKLAGIASGANNYTHPSTHAASMITGLATVATSGSYNDLSNKPTIPTVPASLKNPYSLTIQGNGTTLTNGTYDGSAAKTVNITASSIGAAASSHTHTKSQITDFPTIPTVNNATLTIQKNGTNVATFTANSSTNATANITVPTKVSELTNDSGFKTTDNDTKNTAGSTNSTSKLFLIGATSQGANPQTYSHSSVYATNGALVASTVAGAVYNDYAEYRTQKETIEPGYCVASTDNGEVYKTTEKFAACDGIVSDTFGFSIGETETAKTPLAVAGRVLAYCAGSREDYHAGDTVCAGPEGKIMKMTREEIKEWPDRIIGIVSEIPSYDTWGTDNVAVNGRIWIKVR